MSTALSRDTVPYRPKPGEIPTRPGVYRFRDTDGRVLYVGKAKNLRARLSRLYGDGAVLALHERAEGGVEAVLRLPLRAAADPVVGSGTHTSRVGASEVPARR